MTTYGTDIPVTIPALSDNADIEAAFQLYHTGSTDGTTQSGSLTAAINAKAPLANPTFTGTVVLPNSTVIADYIAAGAVTSGKILDGTIVNDDISASAGISQSKISGLTADLALKAPLANPTFTGTVTGTFSGTATNATNGANYSGAFRKITVLAGATGPSSPSTGDVWISF